MAPRTEAEIVAQACKTFAEKHAKVLTVNQEAMKLAYFAEKKRRPGLGINQFLGLADDAPSASGDDMRALLTASGFDPAILGKTGDDVLAEIIRVLGEKGMLEHVSEGPAAADAKQTPPETYSEALEENKVRAHVARNAEAFGNSWQLMSERLVGGFRAARQLRKEPHLTADAFLKSI